MLLDVDEIVDGVLHPDARLNVAIRATGAATPA